ncbi:hypothetical protein FJK98_11510 [Micromonospora sp. HM134]|nr:hypothetical protein FJK98_11510 [Micromonospora sp. HM134]
MTAPDAVAVYLPPTLVPVEKPADRLEWTDIQVKMFRRFHELRGIRLAESQTVTDLLLRAASGLAQLRANAQRVRYVLYGRATPVAEPYPVNRIDEVRRALGLEHALAFTVTQQNVGTGGHLFCSDAFVNYRTAMDRGLLAPGDRYLVATVGSGEGATTAALVFEH